MENTAAEKEKSRRIMSICQKTVDFSAEIWYNKALMFGDRGNAFNPTIRSVAHSLRERKGFVWKYNNRPKRIIIRLAMASGRRRGAPES